MKKLYSLMLLLLLLAPQLALASEQHNTNQTDDETVAQIAEQVIDSAEDAMKKIHVKHTEETSSTLQDSEDEEDEEDEEPDCE